MATRKSDNSVETALRTKLRFKSTRGDLSLEQLWDVPLRSRDGFDLNSIAKAVNADLQTAREENFVDSSKTVTQTNAELALGLVKHVIEVKLDEEEDVKARASRRAEREKLLEALSKKQDAALDSLSERDIKKRLEALSD